MAVGAVTPARAVRSPWRITRIVTLVLATSAVAVVAGFLAFAIHVGDMKAEIDAPVSDAIVVLTGGNHRLGTGLQLLEDGKAKRLLISGVHPDTSKGAIRQVTNGDRATFSCCVDLGYAALDTVGNATESAQWLDDNGFRNVLLVTSNYHMPRSLLEARRAYTGIDVRPYPVVVSDLANGGWLTNRDALRLLMTEYVKYLAALAGASPRYNGQLAQAANR